MWLPLLLTVLLVLWDRGSAYDCYICSWSPKDENNRTNICSEGQFVPQNVHRDNCDKGCEIYIQWDLNGELEHVRRNCADKITGKCIDETTKTHRRKQCTCSADLCNSAKRWAVSSLPILLVTSYTALFAFAC